MDDERRNRVWLSLPERHSKLAIRVRLLPWTPNEIAGWAWETISDRRGTWVTGAPGAIAEFPCMPERRIDVDVGDASIIAHADDAAFRLRVSDKIRAFAFADGGPIVLGLPRGRAGIPSHETVQTLGTDTDAIDEAHRSDKLFDLGVGRKSSRFCVRTADEAFIQCLSGQESRHWSEVMPAIAKDLIAASPHRVVESAAARIEVFTPIPPDTTSGAHAHFLSDHLQSGEEMPASLTLPVFAMPIAIFYPATASA